MYNVHQTSHYRGNSSPRELLFIPINKLYESWVRSGILRQWNLRGANEAVLKYIKKIKKIPLFNKFYEKCATGPESDQISDGWLVTGHVFSFGQAAGHQARNVGLAPIRQPKKGSF
jgi:hypothetical protein